MLNNYSKKFLCIFQIIVSIVLLSSCYNISQMHKSNPKIVQVDKSEVSFDSEALNLYKPIVKENTFGAKIFKSLEKEVNTYRLVAIEYKNGKIQYQSEGSEFKLGPSDYLLLEVYEGKVNSLLFGDNIVKNVMDYAIKDVSIHNGSIVLWSWQGDYELDPNFESPFLFTSYSSKSNHINSVNINEVGLEGISKYKDMSGILVQLVKMNDQGNK